MLARDERYYMPAINIYPPVISVETSLGKRPGDARPEALTNPPEEDEGSGGFSKAFLDLETYTRP
jgi:hypothetical protein